MSNLEQEYISKEKAAEITAELDFLKNTRRSQLALELERARSLGDLSENAEYHQAREDQGYNEDRINQIEHILRTAKILDNKKKSSTSVTVGSKLIIVKSGEKTKREIEIVGGEEPDSTLGKFSFHSPLGSALLGKVEGDKIEIDTPKGKVEYKVVEML
jgi:transcription elongation factor GreA